MKKKGAIPEGLNISVLVILIALFIIGYLVLLPPEERKRILEIEEVEEGKLKTLLIETPGLIGPLKERIIRYKLAPINLFLRTEPDISYISSSLYLERGFFTRTFREFSFILDNLDNLRRVDLYFLVRDPKGVLHVKLNGEEVYSNRVMSNELISVNFPLRLLGEVNNVELSVSFSLFERNHYSLEDINIRREYRTENTIEDRYFVVSSYEYDNLRGAELSYFMYCNDFLEEGVNLKIRLNDRPFKDMTVPCATSDTSFGIGIKNLKQGENKLSFEIDKGDYLFDDIELNLELKEEIFITYPFVVDEEDYKAIVDEDLTAVLDLVFADIDKFKDAQIFINGNRIYLYTKEGTYSKDISNYLREGDNWIKIIPQNTFEIINLEINLK